MEEEKCEECSNWAESMYWTHFQNMHFCQILDADFHSQLAIPKKFSENAREKLKETVTLKGPSGTATWQVKLKPSDHDELILKDGWTEFVNAFSMEEHDILIFKYTGNSSFHVLIFDRYSLCERESSYFIKKCGHSELGKTEQTERPMNENPPKKLKLENYGANNSVSIAKQKGSSSDNVGVAKERSRTPQRSWAWEPVKLSHAENTKKPAKKEPKMDFVTYNSRRRPVTEEEKKKALQAAAKELTSDSFLIILRPTHVYKKFFLTLPAEWVAKHLMIYEKQAVRLQTNEKTWLTRLIFSSNGRGGLSFGWKDFSIDNCLEESDVCVFKLSSKAHEPVQLNVNIFRVVPEQVKSVRVSPTSTKKNL